MLTEEQHEVISFLSMPSSHGGSAVERIETHASIVFLAGSRALKLKRAVKYDYLDFSTLGRRRAMCEAELRVNRRTAPTLYRGVIAVTRHSDGSLALDGAGSPVEWLVDMQRFNQDDLLDRRAASGTLSLDLMRPLATAVARLHQCAEARRDHGGTAGMTWVVDGNAEGFAHEAAQFLDPSMWIPLTRAQHQRLRTDRMLLDSRRDAGLVRHCHGDLHLRNIVLLDGVPTLFDGIEFNDEIACVDVLYDLAFLLMDLWKRGLPTHANGVWNGYLFETGDLDGIRLMPLFLSCRAAVRAKTSGTAAHFQSDPIRRRDLGKLAGDYLLMAQRLLQTSPPCVVAIGGYSGSGKSTLARALAAYLGAVPGAVVIRSDEVRKQLCGKQPLERLGPEGYTAEVTRRVYATVAERAASVVRGGHAALIDAVYSREGDRSLVERVAGAAKAPFVGLWLEAPESVLLARATQRRHDASDANAEVIRHQLAEHTGPISWHHVDASVSVASVLHNAQTLLHRLLPPEAIRVTTATAMEPECARWH
jgi:aminoglycoside phosphotransferase family enzyme/predicted kinase